MCQPRVWSIQKQITLLRKDPQDGMEHHNPYNVLNPMINYHEGGWCIPSMYDDFGDGQAGIGYGPHHVLTMAHTFYPVTSARPGLFWQQGTHFLRCNPSWQCMYVDVCRLHSYTCNHRWIYSYIIYHYMLSLHIHIYIYTYCRASHTGDAIRDAIVVGASVLFMRSARARRRRAQCDVLVIPHLVTILPHVCCRIFVLVLLPVVVLVFVAAVVVVAGAGAGVVAAVVVAIAVVLATQLIYFRIFCGH